jgi:hypothetical protein
MSVKPGDVCIDLSTLKPGSEYEPRELFVRKLSEDKKRAVVHRVVFPTGVVSTVPTDRLIVRDGQFWRPCSVKKE